MTKIKKPIQTKWFKVGPGKLSLAVLRLPNWAFTIEVKMDNSKAQLHEYEFAMCLFCFALMYGWTRVKI